MQKRWECIFFLQTFTKLVNMVVNRHGIFRNELLFHSYSFQQQNIKNKSFALLMVSECFSRYSLLGIQVKSKVSPAGFLLAIILLAQILHCNSFPWAHWIILEIGFVSGRMMVNSCRLEQFHFPLQSTKFAVGAEILMSQTHQTVSNSEQQGWLAGTTEAYCCVSHTSAHHGAHR